MVIMLVFQKHGPKMSMMTMTMMLFIGHYSYTCVTCTRKGVGVSKSRFGLQLSIYSRVFMLQTACSCLRGNFPFDILLDTCRVLFSCWYLISIQSHMFKHIAQRSTLIQRTTNTLHTWFHGQHFAFFRTRTKTQRCNMKVQAPPVFVHLYTHLCI